MTPAKLVRNAIGSPLFNPSPRLRSLLERPVEGGDADRSSWSRMLGELVPRDAAGALPAERDLAPMWLIEPRDPGFSAKDPGAAMDALRESLRNAEGTWPQQLPLAQAPLHRLYVTPEYSPSANGFYLPNGGLLVARPGERFRVSRTCIAVADKSPLRLPTPMEVWRHALFARTACAPPNGLASGRNDLDGAVVALPAERRMLLRPWAPSRALPGTALDHRALGFYVMLVTFTALLSLLTASLDGLVGAASLLVVAACVMYGIRPHLFARALTQTPTQRGGGVLAKLGRLTTYLYTMLALPAQSVLNPHVSFFVLAALPLVLLLAAGPRRSTPWLALLALSSCQFWIMVRVE